MARLRREITSMRLYHDDDSRSVVTESRSDRRNLNSRQMPGRVRRSDSDVASAASNSNLMPMMEIRRTSIFVFHYAHQWAHRWDGWVRTSSAPLGVTVPRIPWPRTQPSALVQPQRSGDKLTFHRKIRQLCAASAPLLGRKSRGRWCIRQARLHQPLQRETL